MTLDGLLPDYGPLSYGELRRLEHLLHRYRSTVGDSGKPTGVVAAAGQVLVDVAKRAGKAQRAQERQCSWCGRMHTDPPPDLCGECNAKSRTVIAQEGTAA